MMSDLTVTTDEIPTWLTVDFFHKVLSISEDIKFKTVQYACAKGDNFASQIYRVALEYDDGKIESLIVKSRPLGGFSGDFVKKFNVFPKEIEMYQNVDRFEKYYHAIEQNITFSPK